jgi:glycosyltransferase involved in cell wall biosynthesis
VRDKPELAILIPCYNEEITIGKVIQDFRAQLPDASVYVFDNCCIDRTADIAREHGARVISEPRKGKGYVIESMLDAVRADFYVLVDGDDTYPAERVHDLLDPVRSGEADMVVGARLTHYDDKSFRPLHMVGNRLVCNLINKIFNAELTDIMSGYRAFNRKVVQRIPVVSSGFEVETELTVQMLYYRMKIIEITVMYRGRPKGSISKLRFGGFGLVAFFLGILAGIPPIYDYIQSGYTEVRRFPLAILATGLVLLASSLVFLGIILHAVNWRFKELHNVMTRRHD